MARIGGEEFAVVLPETGIRSRARCGAWKLRAGVANKSFKVNGRDVDVTASFRPRGGSSRAGRRAQVGEQLLKVADAALYRSKNSGRNRVTATMLPARTR